MSVKTACYCATSVARYETVCEFCAEVGYRPEPPVITARLAQSEQDCEHLRLIRNSGHETMSRNQRIIGPVEQSEWWEARDKYAIWLYSVRERTVGYALLQKSDDGRVWVTVGVYPDVRGGGLGTAIHRHIRATWPGNVWAETLQDNAASIRSKEKVGWVLVGGEGDLVYHVSRGL